MRRRKFLKFGAGAALAGAAIPLGRPAIAQLGAWPTKPVKVVVPFAAGGGTDSVARPWCEKLSQIFGQQFVVENRGGASGIIGTEAAARSVADGYTLLVSSSTTTVNLPLLRPVPYDPKSLEPIAARADDQRPLRRGEQRVAVGLRAIDDLGAEVLRRAGAVLDHDRLAEFRREMLGRGCAASGRRWRRAAAARRCGSAATDSSARRPVGAARAAPAPGNEALVSSAFDFLPRSLPLDAARHDNLAPARGLGLQERADLLGRAADRRQRHLAPFLLDLRLAQNLGEGARQLVGDLRRRLRRRDHGEPARRHHLGIGLRDRRQVGQLRRALSRW